MNSNIKTMIFLYGPPASGKTEVGRQLAQTLRLPFYDLDEAITRRAGRPIPEIFAANGEETFRELESTALQEVVNRSHGVVSLGGGALLRAANRLLVEEAGVVVCLQTPFETILTRLQASAGGRPLLDGDTQVQLQDLLSRRRDHYQSFSIQVENDGQQRVEEVVWQTQRRLGVFHISGMGSGYDVRVAVGGLTQIGKHLACRGLSGPVAVVTDENVGPLYANQVQEALQAAGFASHLTVIPAGEDYKTFATVQQLCRAYLQAGLERGSTVIALGGGVVGDLAGFAAAIYLRGVRWVAVPTSLLAMVDASLGGKTGADLPQGKNLVGAFHPPSLVLADPQVLATLPETELRNGLAEVIKHGILGDPGLFTLCAQGWDAINEDMAEVVRRAIAVKAAVIQADPYEDGGRAQLNLGHTLGHGIELASDFHMKHGEAVAVGMSAAARLAEKVGVAEIGLAHQIEVCLHGVGLPSHLPPGIDLARTLAAMGFDKKRRGGAIRLVLPRRIGEVIWDYAVSDPSLLIEAAKRAEG